MSDYDLLGLKPGASVQDAKRARNKLARELHPDRPENQGADPSQLAEINAAFDRILAGAPKLDAAARTAQPQSRAHAWRDFQDFDAKPSPESDAAASSRGSSRYRRDPEDIKAQYARQGAEGRYSRKEKAGGRPDDENGGPSGAEKATQDFYRQARGRDTHRQEELRRKAQERAARESSTSFDEIGTGQQETTLNASADRREQMREAIEKRKKQEAYRRVTELRGGIYPDPRQRIDTNRGDLPGFHMAEHIRFEGRTMQIHLAGEAKEGRNIIAMPEMEMVNGRTVRQGRGVSIFEVSNAAGAGRHPIQGDKTPVSGASGLAVEVIFGSELAKRRARGEGERA